MADNEIIAAILVAGMLPSIPAPAARAKERPDVDEQEQLVLAVLHAAGLYRSVLESLSMWSDHGRVHMPQRLHRACSERRQDLPGRRSPSASGHEAPSAAFAT